MPHGEHFLLNKIEIWVGFGLVGITENKFKPIMSNFLGQFFNVFMGSIFKIQF